MPTLAGFQLFILNSMGINTTVLPQNSTDIVNAYNLAIDTVNLLIANVSTNYYSLAVYNLAGDFLINFAQDQAGQTYFSGLRSTFHINDFVPGVVSTTSDESTSTALEVTEQFKNLIISDLQNLKTPYGRMYLSIAQKFGGIWGVD